MLYEQTDLLEFRNTAMKLSDRYLQFLDQQEQQALTRHQTAGQLPQPPTAPAAGAVGNASLLAQQQQLDRWVPMWDFDAPYRAELDGPRDTSAGAVAALGMLHLARALQPEDETAAAGYLCAAVSTLRALATAKYMVSPGTETSEGLLKHATGGMPLGLHIDVSLITADYYFLAALQLCSSWPACRGFGTSAAAQQHA